MPREEPHGESRHGSSSVASPTGVSFQMRREGMWKPDSAARECEECAAVFTWWRRRHHCRRCGGLFCGRCSQGSAVLPYLGAAPVRVCDGCEVLSRLPAHPQPPQPAEPWAHTRSPRTDYGSFESTPGPTSSPTTPSPCDLPEVSAFKQVPRRGRGDILRLSPVDGLRSSSAAFSRSRSFPSDTPSPPPLDVPRSAGSADLRKVHAARRAASGGVSGPVHFMSGIDYLARAPRLTSPHSGVHPYSAPFHAPVVRRAAAA